jgi:hypothetical protein
MLYERRALCPSSRCSRGHALASLPPGTTQRWSLHLEDLPSRSKLSSLRPLPDSVLPPSSHLARLLLRPDLPVTLQSRRTLVNATIQEYRRRAARDRRRLRRWFRSRFERSESACPSVRPVFSPPSSDGFFAQLSLYPTAACVYCKKVRCELSLTRGTQVLISSSLDNKAGRKCSLGRPCDRYFRRSSQLPSLLTIIVAGRCIKRGYTDCRDAPRLRAPPTTCEPFSAVLQAATD